MDIGPLDDQEKLVAGLERKQRREQDMERYTSILAFWTMFLTITLIFGVIAKIIF